jgi:hypothetical protein
MFNKKQKLEPTLMKALHEVNTLKTQLHETTTSIISIKLASGLPLTVWENNHLESLSFDTQKQLNRLVTLTKITAPPATITTTNKPITKPDAPVKVLKRWTRSDEKQLMKMYGSNASWADIAHVLQRTPKACQLHIYKMQKAG